MTIVGRPKKDKSLRILCIFVLIRISVTSRFPFWQLRPRSEYLHRNGRDVAINGALCRSGRRQIIGKPIVKFPNLTRGCPKKNLLKAIFKNRGWAGNAMGRQGPHLTSSSRWVGEPDYAMGNLSNKEEWMLLLLVCPSLGATPCCWGLPSELAARPQIFNKD